MARRSSPGSDSAKRAVARLLVAPGGRYREEHPDGRVLGYDGERSWWLPMVEVLDPSFLLSGLDLDVRGPAGAAGRPAKDHRRAS